LSLGALYARRLMAVVSFLLVESNKSFMPDRWYKVSLVVDSDYGERLHSLVTDAVWIIDRPANRMAVETLRHLKEAAPVTTFASLSSVPKVACLGVLHIVDLHHGEYSGGYSVLEVVGTSLDEEVRSAIKELGFSKFEETSEGFLARR
jgi:hypothetical protein